MKKSAYILITFAVAAAVSCAKETAPQEPETCILTAEFADGDAETKTTITYDNKTRWTLNDKILIKGSDGSTITGTATSLADNGRIANFTMNKPVVSGSRTYASYPSNLVYNIENQYALYVSNTPDGSFAKANLSFGKVNGSSIKFMNATGLFRIIVSDSYVKKIKMVSTDASLGGFYVLPYFDSKGYLIGVTATGFSQVRQPIVISTPEPGAYYVAVQPTIYSPKSICFEYLDASGKTVCKYTYPKSLNVGLGKMVDWGDLSNPGAPVIPDGALPGVFSVSDTKKVRFSKGNLQASYSTSTSKYTWGFAANQYDFVGNVAGNTTIGNNKEGDVVDLFGWSTDSNTRYGINTSGNNSGYSGNFRDWGNKIGDGSTWRTLSKDEWVYLFKTRTNASKLYKYGVTVCGKANCLIIAPDGFAGTIDASYNASNWPAAEATGLVCLPAAGNRDGSDVFRVGGAGYYWSSSAHSSISAYRVYFDSSDVYSVSDVSRAYGFSVRLITDVK